MLLTDLLQETVHSTTSNKARSGLTILGIVIGIASVIAMVAIGQGAQQSIQERISSMGSNLLMVSPGAQRSFGSTVRSGQGSAGTLTVKDADEIRDKIASIKAVAPEVSSRKQVTSKGKNTNTSITGTNEAYTTVKNLDIQSGSFFTSTNVKSMSKVAVIGPTVQTDLFDTGTNPVGQKIKIGNLDFTVIGVTQTKGNNEDDKIFIPITTAQHFLSGSESVSIINISVIDESAMGTAQDQITSLLLSRHKISDPISADFSIMNMADLQETISATTQTFTLLLGSIGAISLVVGGIGIMNMMLTTVTERTREIGLRKALGARKKDISMQFLAEALMITVIGGIIGIILGWLIAFAIEKFSSLNLTVSLSSVILAFGVSGLIGIVFGFYPARRAAALNPIDALRYE